MTDITKCRSKQCPSREECYRQRAPDNPYQQSYANFYTAGEECQYFQPVKFVAEVKK